MKYSADHRQQNIINLFLILKTKRLYYDVVILYINVYFVSEWIIYLLSELVNEGRCFVSYVRACVRVCVRVCFRIHIERQQAKSINISKHPLRPTPINLKYNYAYINLNIKCSLPPHIYTYIHLIIKSATIK